MSEWWHKVEHIFGWNTGRVVSDIDEAGWIWIAFQCDQCGKVSGRHTTKRVTLEAEK